MGRILMPILKVLLFCFLCLLAVGLSLVVWFGFFGGDTVAKRSTVRKVDGSAVGRVFNCSLPGSVKITRAFVDPPALQNRGFVIYEVEIASKDFDKVLATGKLSRLQYEYVEERRFDKYFTRFNLDTQQFGIVYSSTSAASWNNISDGPGSTIVENYIILDDRTSPTLKLYIRTDPHLLVH